MSCPMRLSSRVALFVLLLVGGGQAACASPPRIEALQPTRTAVATLDDWGALLLQAGLPPHALPTGECLSLEQVRDLRLLLSLPTGLEHYAPRRVADTLLREAEERQRPMRREVLNQGLQRFQSLFTLRPDGLLSDALTGRPRQWVGLVEPRDGALRAWWSSPPLPRPTSSAAVSFTPSFVPESTVMLKPPHTSPSTLKAGATLQVDDVSYTVQRVLHRPLPGEAIPGETRLVVRCSSGQGEPRQVLLRCLEGPEDSPHRQRAWDGARLAQRMEHPHIGKVWQVHAEPAVLYIVSEYIAGFDLETVVDYCAMLKRSLLPAFACFIGAAVADALEYAHGLRDEAGRPLGIVHRGINLENIRLGLGGEVKLTGFDGIFSLDPARRMTTTNMLQGDLTYASPEYVEDGQRDRRLDFFSLGLLLLELLTGRHPLDDPYALALAPPTEPVDGPRLRASQSSWLPLGALVQRLAEFGPEEVELATLGQPEAVVALLKHALEREPAKRYQRGAQMREDLLAYLHSLPVPYGPQVAVEEVQQLRAQARSAERGACPVQSDGQ
jgi:serine/threonine protein kinase